MLAILLLLLITLLTAQNIEADEICAEKLDVLVVADSSSSICDDKEPCLEWNAIIQFNKDLAESLTIGLDDSRFAFITMADQLYVEWNLNGFTDKNELQSALGRVAFRGGEFGDLLSTGVLFSSIFNTDYGDRVYAPNIIVWITDGIPSIDREDAVATTNAFKKTGIKVFVVCVTLGCPDTMAKKIASKPKQANVTYFLLDSFLSLDTIRDTLVRQICELSKVINDAEL